MSVKDKIQAFEALQHITPSSTPETNVQKGPSESFKNLRARFENPPAPPPTQQLVNQIGKTTLVDTPKAQERSEPLMTTISAHTGIKSNTAKTSSDLEAEARKEIKEKGVKLDKDLGNLSASDFESILSVAIHTPLPHLKTFVLHKMQEANPIAKVEFSDQNIPMKENFLLLELAARPFDAEMVKDFKALVNLGYLITPTTVKVCMLFQNLPLLNFIFSQPACKNWMQSQQVVILEELLKTSNANTAEILFHHFPDLGAQCPSSLLQQAVEKGNSKFVEWIMEHGKNLSTEENEKFLKLAIGQYNLPLIRQFSTEKNTQSFLKILGLEALTGPEQKQKRFEILLNFALNSPMSEIYKLVEAHPHFVDVLPEVLEKVPLLVRFPKAHRSELNFTSDKQFYNQTNSYATENANFVKEVVSKLPSMSRDQFLDAIVQNRFDRNPKLIELYKEKMVNAPDNLPHTPLLVHVSREREVPIFLLGVGAVEPLRYYESLTHLSNLLYDKNHNTWQLPSQDQLISRETEYEGRPVGMIAFPYALPSGEKVEVTRLTLSSLSTRWLHPEQPTVSKMQNHLEELHRELINYKLDASDPANKKEFLVKLTKAYWLMATLCEMKRGTPHNSMIFLNAICTYQGLPPPIPKQEHFFLDNTMLMTTINHAIEHWEEYFEPTIDQVLGKEKTKELIALNPALSRFCTNLS